jgi:putative DNA primase/helicase
MSDTISILRHNVALMAKTWKSDGTIASYGDAKYFTLEERQVNGLAELSELLTELQAQRMACVIRGKYVGDALARERDPAGFQPGKVRRALDYFDDQPLHTVLIDVDGFEPLCSDALEDPRSAIDEFVFTMLPEPFRAAGYHWQLSNSAGHPSKGSELRAHLWFWLAKPLTSAQLRAWAKATGLKADLALFNPVQVHYTASPVFEPGQVDPFAERSGLVSGLFGDEVVLEIDEALLAQATGSSGGRGARLREVVAEDPIAQALYDQGLVKSQRPDGALNIACPFEDGHTTKSGESSTVYFPPNTGGYAVGHFKCLHASCADRTRGMFLARLGVDEVINDFEDVSTEPVADADAGEAPKASRKRKNVPEAQHLTTDQANAGRIVDKFGKRLIVVAGQWYAWTGMRWERDEGEVYRCACRLSKIIHAEADGWRAKPTKAGEEAERNQAVAEALEKWAKKSEMKSTIDAAVGLAKKMLAVGEDQIDRNPWLLNCTNGTVDLRTGELKPHDPSDFITKLVPVAYDPAVCSQIWETVVARVTLEEGLTTRPLARFLQRWFGYCATGSTREQAFVVHYGQGSNGKSTILDTIADVLGDYAATAAPGLLVGGGNDRHPTEIADLFGRRMVTAHETGEGGHLKEDTVKQLTGSDKVKARFMRADFFEFEPTHKLQLLTNYKPIIKGQDNGIWRRVLLVPYLARFGSPEEVAAGWAHFVKDTRVAERLKAELQGVLTWVVEGARAWFQDGLQPPDAVLAASRDYQAEQDRVGQFINECCELGPELEAPLTDGLGGGLYEAYRAWCGESGFHALSKIRFSQEVERVVPSAQKFRKKVSAEGGGRRDVIVFKGLRLLED